MASGVLVRYIGIYETGTYDLEFDCFAVNVDGTNLKVDSYRAEVALRVGVLGEPQEKARLNMKAISFSHSPVGWEPYLSYTGITDEEEFEEIVVVVGHSLWQFIVVVVK